MTAAGRQRLWVAAAALTVGVTRILARARIPDNYDSIGFVRALDRFDLAAFQPHFPGYPIYIALAKCAHAVVLDPLLAATTISALASALTSAVLFPIARSLGGSRAGFTAMALYAAAWLPLHLGGSALSESLAVLFATVAFACLSGGDGVKLSTCSRRELITRVALAGAAMGLMLGTRLSYWPLVFSVGALTPRRAWGAAALGLAVGNLIWLLPFAAVVGVRQLARLGVTHVKGHFTIWGGSVVSEPQLLDRAVAFVRGTLYDGLAPSWPASVGLALLVVIAARFKRPRSTPWLLVAPYAVWALVAQNIVAQPRHLLPLVIASCIGLAAMLAEKIWLAGAAVALMFSASLPLAWARVHSEPAAAHAARWVAENYQASEVVVMGGRSIRFFGLIAPRIVTRERTWLSEVDVELARLDRFPRVVLVTSEVEPDAGRAPHLGDAVTFCRDPRIDRAQPCLSLKTYRIGPGTP